ncbi:general stress protein CsbD [Mycobacterium kyorinense]|uniref:General stress protein CsbD n=1 Tax=Mycobacterium kyorinense TaxID=487514 RepID=A0A1A2YZQ3_9MYCO|nr:CsbD family protein [Mycobacterium kyorinense]OBI42732.1 general stress protein CsbD [Mycobacterium kyorinense]
MSLTDKARNKLQKVKGAAKETLGRATGDRNLENRGVGDRIGSDLKDAGEKVKDAFRGRGGGRGRRRV